LEEIKHGKAAGPDELPAIVLKEVAKEISAILTMIFEKSCESGTIPDGWASVNPIKLQACVFNLHYL